MGKKERTSTFKLNEDWDENWGQVTAKNNVEGKISLIWQITKVQGGYQNPAGFAGKTAVT